MSKSKTKVRKIEMHGVYDLDEAAELLDVSPRTVRQYVREEKIHAKKVGKAYRVTGDNILSFLGSATVSQMKPDS